MKEEKRKVKPSYEEVKELSEKYKTIPLYTKFKADVTTEEVVERLKNVSSHCFMLESSEDAKHWGRYTFIGFDPKAEVTCKDGAIKVTDEDGVMRYEGDPRPYIRKIMRGHQSPRFSELPTFTGGLVGYFGYDYVKYSEKGVCLDAKDDASFKDVDLMLFDKVIAFDNLENEIIVICNMQTENMKESYRGTVREIEIVRDIIENGKEKEELALVLKTPFKPLFSETEYCNMVEKAKHYIREGDIFQVVLSNKLEAETEGSLFGTYQTLKKKNPSPYMFYFSSNDIEIAGASPETLVKLTGDTLYTYPLAGTRPRGKTKAEDEALEKSLLCDEKELAEHNMLLDLGRNDLGKISEFGSVKVEEFHNILRFSHVMHLGSTVSGKIKEGFDALDAIDAVLPAGTLSGAPKVRAMQIINELENNRRGIYGGAIGYIDFTGNMDTCIAIRLAYKKRDKVYVRSGAGIVADSVPKNEYRECLNKAGAVMEAIEEQGASK